MIIKYTKRISALFFAVVLTLCSGICAFAESDRNLIDDGYLFSTDEASQIETELNRVSRETGWDVVVLTNRLAVEKEDMEDYCNRYYDSHNFGKGSEKSGVFLTVDMGSREMYIITKGDAMYYFSDERVDDIVSDVAGELSQDNFFEAAYEFSENVEYYYDEGKPEYGDFSNVELAEKESNPLLYVLKHYGIIAGVIGIAAAAVTVIIVAYRYKNNGKEGIYDLNSNSTTNLTQKDDVFLRKSVSVVNVSNSNSSGGGSSSRSGGRSSHGGGGSSF